MQVRRIVWFVLLCHFSRIVSHGPFFGSLAFLNISRALWFIIWRIVWQCLGPWRVVLLYHVSWERQYVKSVLVELSTLFRRLHAFSACAVYDTSFPIQGAIWTLSLWRGLVELEDFGMSHLSNQILWFLTEVVDLLRQLKVFQQHIPVLVIFNLFN